MRVLVTGATGFLGSRLVKTLLEEHFEVIILKRSFSDMRRIASILSQVSCYDIDQCKLEQPFLDFNRFDAIIHMATCYGRKKEKFTEIFETNTVFPLKLLDLGSSFNVKIFLNTDTFLKEDPTLYNYLNFYSLTKKHLVDWGKVLGATGKIHFVNIKLEHPYGPGDDELKFTTHVIKSCLSNVPELRLTWGEQKRDFIYIDDIVRAYSLLLHQANNWAEEFKEVELGTGESTTIREFVETAHRLAASKTILKFGAVPYRDHEIMESKANPEFLKSLGWSNQTTLDEGIQKILMDEGIKE